MSMKEKFADAVELLKSKHGLVATVEEVEAVVSRVRNLTNEFRCGSYTEACAIESLSSHIESGRQG